MSIVTTDTKVTYQGNGVTTEWPFTFPVLDKDHLQVILTDATGAEKTLTKDYVVDLNNKKVKYPGYESGQEPPVESRPPVLPAGSKITLLRLVPYTQEADLGERWPFDVVEDMADLTTMQIQQLAEQVNRCIKIGVTSQMDPTDLLGAIDAATTTAVTSATSAATSATAAKDLLDHVQEMSANLDGGNARSVYLGSQIHDGGGANG